MQDEKKTVFAIAAVAATIQFVVNFCWTFDFEQKLEQTFHFELRAAVSPAATGKNVIWIRKATHKHNDDLMNSWKIIVCRYYKAFK